jgi:REP element-mobilizing transposase RayT
MSNKYKNKYKTKSLRLQNFDYSSDGAYFITICTGQTVQYFGGIEQSMMNLSSLGIIANILWYEIKSHARHCKLGEFVVMPNHIHGILILGDHDAAPVETRHALSPQQQQPIVPNRFQNQGKNTISAIVGGYKSAVTKHASRLGFDFQWQRNYWEHIIRNDDEYSCIAQYILENPQKWALDKLNGGVGNQVMEAAAPYNDEGWMI